MNRRETRGLTAMWLLGLAMATAAVPPGAAGSAAQGVAQASYGGARFSYDTSLASDVQGETIASNVGQGGMAYDVRPQHTSFTFQGYTSSGIWTPRMRVIPYAEYMSSTARYSTAGELGALDSYLRSDMGRKPPLLPSVNQARVFDEDLVPVAGAGVAGVRFVAAYSQGIVPVAAKDLVYVFLGLTVDKQYYVEATFPVQPVAPLDPAPPQVTPDSVQTHNQAVAATLRRTPPAGYRPNLDLLDKMMGSVEVTATPGMPKTGAAPDPTWLLVVLIASSLVVMAAGALVQRRMRQGRVPGPPRSDHSAPDEADHSAPTSRRQ